jgi:hypothetical protein
MVGALSRELNMKFLINLDQRQVIRQVRGQSEHTLKSVKVEYVENHFPKEQPVFAAKRRRAAE